MEYSTVLERVKPHLVPIILGVCGLVFLIVGFVSLIPQGETKGIVFEEAKKSSTPEKRLSVDVEGAVEKPGVYDLPSDARVKDALIAAGGLSLEADRAQIAKTLNLAAKLTDGGKIYLPVLGEMSISSNTGAPGGASLNINTVSAKELDGLSGIGEVTAGKIIANRPYGTIEELVAKKVVSKKVFEQIKEKIAVF